MDAEFTIDFWCLHVVFQKRSALNYDDRAKNGQVNADVTV